MSMASRFNLSDQETVMKLSKKPAFTLIELLTVLGVIAVLSAILLPSVVQTQDEARRGTCKNHLKQLALAIHNYHDVYASFPPGWVAKDQKANSGPWYGWQAAILPYMEQAPLFNKLNLNDYGKTDEAILKTVIPLYRCPSDSMIELNPLRGKYATSSYSGNAGSQRLPGSVDPLKTLNGVFWWNSHCRFADIKDGTSNTFLFGERCITSGSGIWMGLTKNRNENDAISDCSHHSQLNKSIESFSSTHPGIVQFALCDGSVRLVSEKIDSSDDEKNPGLFQKLADRADGFPIGDF
jgi:prepilin-type N-terminal cleavage/methylation domain-containing protein